ncbi:hypothetical protein VP01_3377g2 [Puccinia sorghi]|uniref:Uncharacterized protein n=1 Tax=Puccinia sorghi TaxID=27349 RepID=A0A0L6UWT9_9BASI|nr:hypothetical protein VP01_3377g2 [Puccinia sorghi]
MAVSVTITSEEGWQRRKTRKGGNKKSILLYRNMKLQVKYQPLNLYPTVPLNENLKPTCHPTPEEVTCSCKRVDSTFFLLHSGRCVITGPKDRMSFIAVIEFTPWEQLTEKDKDDLKFSSTFLHGLKEFINPVASSRRSWSSSKLLEDTSNNLRRINERSTMGQDGPAECQGVQRLHSKGPEGRGRRRGSRIGAVLQGVEISGDSGVRELNGSGEELQGVGKSCGLQCEKSSNKGVFAIGD